MSQTLELTDQDLERIDRLVRNGVFIDRYQVLRVSLESLTDLSEDEIKKIKTVRSKVNSFLETDIGNLLFAGTPIKIVVDGNELYRVAAKGNYKGKTRVLGHIYMNSNSLEINKELSTPAEKIFEEAERIVKENEGTVL